MNHPAPNNPSPKIPRRRFLQGLGALAVSSALAPLPTLHAGSAGSNGALKVGVLVPPSHIYADLAERFIAGLNAYGRAVENAPHMRLVYEPIKISQQNIHEKATYLLEQQRVDAVVAYISPFQGRQLAPLLAEHGKPLLIANPGAQFMPNTEPNPYFFQHSLHFWASNFLAGEWAANHLGKRALLSTSLYDSGFDAVGAFETGFKAAGGEALQIQVMDIGIKGESGANLRLEAGEFDFIYALYSGQTTRHFLAAYLQMKNTPPLLTSAFMIDESLHYHEERLGLGLRSFAAWSNDLNNKSAQAAQTAYQALTGQNFNALGLLGYETAALLSAAFEIGGRHNLAEALQQAQVMSPRGALQMDKDSHSTKGKLYLREAVRDGSTLGLKHQIINEFSALSESDERIVAQRNLLRSGWVYPYLGFHQA